MDIPLVYVVIGQTYCYSESETWNVAWYEREADATHHAAVLNALAKLHQAHWKAMMTLQTAQSDTQRQIRNSKAAQLRRIVGGAVSDDVTITTNMVFPDDPDGDTLVRRLAKLDKKIEAVRRKAPPPFASEGDSVVSANTIPNEYSVVAIPRGTFGVPS